MKYFFIIFFSLLLSHSVFADETPIIREIIHPEKAAWKVGSDLVIYGENFGNDPNSIKVFIGDKDYSVAKIYGNELYFKVTQDMHSGNIIVKKTIQENGANNTIVSNIKAVDFQEAILTKMEAPEGLLPKKSLIFYGKNLSDSKVLCNKTELSIKENTGEKISIILPESFLQCSLQIEKNGFIAQGETISIIPFIAFSSLEFQGNKLLLNGKNFDLIKEDLSQIKVQIPNTSLSSPEYVSPSQIRLTINGAFPSSGNAQILFASSSYPLISFSIDNSDIPFITKISELSYQNGNYVFTISTNTSLQKEEVLIINKSPVQSNKR